MDDLTFSNGSPYNSPWECSPVAELCRTPNPTRPPLPDLRRVVSKAAVASLSAPGDWRKAMAEVTGSADGPGLCPIPSQFHPNSFLIFIILYLVSLVSGIQYPGSFKLPGGPAARLQRSCLFVQAFQKQKTCTSVSSEVVGRASVCVRGLRVVLKLAPLLAFRNCSISYRAAAWSVQLIIVALPLGKEPW